MLAGTGRLGQNEIVVVLSPEHVGYIKSAGWSKQQVKNELFKVAQRKMSDWIKAGAIPASSGAEDLETMKGVARGPESITVIVAGGLAGAFSNVIPLWGHGGANSRSVTKEIRSPW